MIINLSKQDPDDPQTYVESERNRASRQKQLNAQAEHVIRAHDIAEKRADRLDRYFAAHPPNGKKLDIFRDTLLAFKNTNGEAPMWMTYEHLEACFDRLQRAGVLAVEMAEDSLGVKTYKSEVTKQALANQRNVRPPEIDTLIQQLKQALGDALQQPPVPPDDIRVRGCRQVTLDKWRVRLYVGGAMRALGCYPFETAIRLQDALTRYFKTYRHGLAHYTTSESEAEAVLAKAAVYNFAIALEKHWLAAGVLQLPGSTAKPADWRATIEARLTLIETHVEARLTAIEAHLKIVP